jgi:hypothetical protein
MRSAHITRRQAEALLDGLAADEDVFAVQEEEAMRVERDEVDRLVEEVDRDLAVAPLAESARGHLRGVRPARRARRRASRVRVRSLPVRGASGEPGGEVA